MSSVVAIIPARGGSKGIPRKNLVDFCGKPLIAWSILQAQQAVEVDSVWVSSDDKEILEIAEGYGAYAIQRPVDISGDEATSESAWLHALDQIEAKDVKIDLVTAMQVTSPLREPSDLNEGIRTLRNKKYDSLLSVTEVADFFTWKIDGNGLAESVNYDYRYRKRRQEIEMRYLENGSFYIFRPELLRRYNNRLGGQIGVLPMSQYKMFQIDNFEDIDLCTAIMQGFKLDQI